jgi:hypothetical protein
VSFGGYTHITIHSFDLDEDPQSNAVFLYSQDLDVKVRAPTLTPDDAFNSNPAVGHIAYRLPSVAQLFGQPQEKFDQYAFMKFELSIQRNDHFGEPVEMKCKETWRCLLTFKKHFTPILLALNPPIVYKNSMTEFWFNPKSTANLMENLEAEDLPFVNAKINGALVDFEGQVDHETKIHGWRWNRVRGRVTDQPPSSKAVPQMLWETGNALIHPSV